jgi:hypothetical protein
MGVDSRGPSAEDRDWLERNCQVFYSVKGENQTKWVTRDELLALTLAGETEGWWVVKIDSETGEPMIVCPYCWLGMKHASCH